MNRTRILLLVIIIFSAFLRIYRLGQIPEGLHADEAAFGYNAYSILKTGKDEYGKSMPVIMKSFGDYKGALYSYLAVPFVSVFGLTEFATRMPSALSGVLLVFLTFILIREITRRDGLSLLSAGIVSLMPVSVLVSRESEPALLATDFIIFGIFALIRWKKTGNIIWFLSALVSMGVSMLTYFIPRLFVLIIIPLVWVTDRSGWKGKRFIYLFSFYLVMAAGVGILTFSSTGARLGQVNIFTTDRVMLPLQEKLREDGVQHLSANTARLFHNKVSEYGRYLMHNYMQYFSFDYLFYEAGQPRREVIPQTGILYLIDLPFLLYGIYSIFRRKYVWGYLFVSWLFVTPVILSFASDETPNIHRNIISALPFAVLIALGITEAVNRAGEVRKGKYMSIAVGMLYMMNAAFFIEALFIHQPVHFPFYRGFAYKQLVSQIPKYYGAYDRIIVTKGNESPYIYFLFYGAYDPQKYQASGSHRDLDYQGFDKYTFVPYDCPSFNESREQNVLTDNVKTLLIRRGGCTLGKNDNLLATTAWDGGSEAFQFVNYQATPASSLRSGSSL